MKSFQQLALIGSTASGKTALALELASRLNAYILSLDSLAVYKEIDIVSAKPNKAERDKIRHFGLDLLYPNETFDVTRFILLYQDVSQLCQSEGKNLVIVGGTSFYLKMLLEGISNLPSISDETSRQTQKLLKDPKAAHAMLYKLDSTYMCHIEPTDSYRIQKALHIYFETSMTPTAYFHAHPPKPVIQEPLPIYQIVWDRHTLRQRIRLRTEQMLQDGLIDEICYLEKKYGRAPNAMKSIGIKETLAYLDGIYDKKMLKEKIITNTARLAKKQTTFNNSQFNHVIKGSVEELKKILL